MLCLFNEDFVWLSTCPYGGRKKKDLAQSKGRNGEILKQFSLTWVRITIAAIITSMQILLKTIRCDKTRQRAQRHMGQVSVLSPHTSNEELNF